MTSPPATLKRACADGACRLRDLRARSVPVGFLVLAASVTMVQGGWGEPALAQFPIRQIPPRNSPLAATAPPAVVGAAPEPASISSPLSSWTSPYPQAAGLGSANTGNPLAAWVHQPHPAVARIVVPERSGVSLGSGTLVDVRGDFGLVVTNWHVVRDAAGPIQVEFPGGFQSPGDVVKTDKDWDLAALSIRRPPAVLPVPVSPLAPRPGQWLAIAGYGSGLWRLVSGPCTQYLAPGAEFPYELVELAAEARQGDSGGPIFNERGELAGVLFGSGPGYTSGAYGGRVLKFLASVVPGGLPGSDTPSPAGFVPNQLAAQRPGEAGPLGSLGRLHAAGGRPWGGQALADAALDGVITPPPQATALHTPPPGQATSVPSLAEVDAFPESPKSTPADPQPAISDMPPLTPVQPWAASPPPANRSASNLVPHATNGPLAEEGLRPVLGEEDPRVAVVLGRVGGNGPIGQATLAEEEAGPAVLQAELPPRRGPSASSGARQVTSTEELLTLVWKWLAGESLYDQAKTVLAIIGLIALAALILRGPAPAGSCEME